MKREDDALSLLDLKSTCQPISYAKYLVGRCEFLLHHVQLNVGTGRRWVALDQCDIILHSTHSHFLIRASNMSMAD
jgi:hypothetical protein